jgi:heme-degrading monooxygenase HmoA
MEEIKMAYMLAQYTVEDVSKFKPVFEEMSPFRKATGSLGVTAFHSKDDPKRVVILIEWKTAADARKWAESDEWKEARQRAGVVGKADVLFLDEIEHMSA